MPRDQRLLLYIGIKGRVVALDRISGDEVWRTELRSSEFVTTLWDGDALFAATSGEAWRLNPKNGEVLWHNSMKGLGRGVVSLASSAAVGSSGTEPGEEKRRRDAQAAAAAAAAG